MTERDLTPDEERLFQIVTAAAGGDASAFSELGVLAALGAVFVCRRRAHDPAAIVALDAGLDARARRPWTINRDGRPARAGGPRQRAWRSRRQRSR